VNREIKFRAYNIEADVWIANINEWDVSSLHSSNLSSVVKVLQYTGLKDKNGVEIYEGDIVNAKRHNFEKWDTCVIKYKPLCFLFEVHREDKNYIAPRNYHQHFEVIGNIYQDVHLLENKELLK